MMCVVYMLDILALVLELVFVIANPYFMPLLDGLEKTLKEISFGPKVFSYPSLRSVCLVNVFLVGDGAPRLELSVSSPIVIDDAPAFILIGNWVGTKELCLGQPSDELKEQSAIHWAESSSFCIAEGTRTTTGSRMCCRKYCGRRQVLAAGRKV